MRYRTFGRLGWSCSALGMGVMCLPGGPAVGPDVPDESEGVRLIRAGIEQGINYLDVGYVGDLERQEPLVRLVGKALAGGYRGKTKLAVTVPAASISAVDELDALLETQLSWLGVDCVDFCLLGRLTRDNWPVLQQMGILDRIERVQGDGRVQHVGFSFHDHYQVLKSIVQAYDRWAVCSVEYGFMDVKHDPGASGISYAADQGLAVVATRPFKGGRLTKEPASEVQELWSRSARQWSRAEWALRFVLNHPAVSVVVSDMSSMQQLSENVAVADVAQAEGLSIADEVTIGNVRDAFRKRMQVPCPSCRPCMPCPAGIDVPRFFEIYNDAAMYEDVETGRALCADERMHPEDCTGCGICETRCAKRLPIVEWLEKGRRFLGTADRH